MADASTVLADGLRDHLFRTASFAKPTELWVSAHTGDPGATGANEVVNGSYARVQRDPGDANWSDEATVGQTKNVAAVDFPTNWAATVTWAGLWDASSGGDFLARAQLAAPKVVGSGDTFSFEAGDLTFTVVVAT